MEQGSCAGLHNVVYIIGCHNLQTFSNYSFRLENIKKIMYHIIEIRIIKFLGAYQCIGGIFMTIGTSIFSNRKKLLKLFFISFGVSIFCSVAGICLGYSLYINGMSDNISFVKVITADIAIFLFVAMSSFSGLFSVFDFPAVFIFGFVNSYLLCDYNFKVYDANVSNAGYLFFILFVATILSFLSASCFLFSLRHINHSAKYFVKHKKFTVPILMFAVILFIACIVCLIIL